MSLWPFIQEQCAKQESIETGCTLIFGGESTYDHNIKSVAENYFLNKMNLIACVKESLRNNRILIKQSVNYPYWI